MSPILTLYLVWVLWVASWFVASLWSARTVKRSARGSQLVNRFLTLLGIVLLFGIYSPRRMAMFQFWRLDDDWKWALVGVTMLGFAFAWWARLYLGRLWSADVTFKEGHHVVDTGPYRFVRHPIYTGIILSSFATAALEGTMVAMVGAIIMTVAWYLKARTEEELLRRELGVDAYDDYAGRVAMLIPFARL